MAKKINAAQVRRIAELSRLELTDEEVATFSIQLNAILEYVEKLNELDTENVEPLAHCLPVTNVFRDDIAVQSIGAEKALENAPQRDGGFFKVPKILDDTFAA